MEGASRDWFSHFPLSPLPSFSTARTVCRLPLSLHPDLFLHPAGVLFVLPAGKLLHAGSFPLYSDNLKQTNNPKPFQFVLFCTSNLPVSTIAMICKSLLWFSCQILLLKA